MIPFCSIAQTLALEQEAVQAGVSQAVLMENAGNALCQEMLHFADQSFLSTGPALCLVGPGNNGGDGLVCAGRLQAEGQPVQVYMWRRKGLVRDPLLDKLGNLVEIRHAEEDPDFGQLRTWLKESRWIIDCLLGVGVNRPIGGRLADLLSTVKQGLTPEHFVSAADCPSGINCDTGSTDPFTLVADLTVMFGTAKRGLYQDPGQAFTGRTVVADIGLPEAFPELVTGWGLEPPDLPNLLPYRSDWSHKGTFGKAFCLVGSRRYPGAALLSTRSAAKSGAGVVCAAVPSSVQTGLISGMADVTFLPYRETAGTASPLALPEVEEEAQAYSAVLVGCGLAYTSQTRDFVKEFLDVWRRLAGRPIPLVLDADALNCLASLEGWPGLLPPDSVLTPHLAEMGRLCGMKTADVLAHAPELARERARDWNCTVLLKGPQTWIGTPQGGLFAILNSNSALATAGTGDVLAGLVVGLLAQGLEPTRAAKGAALVHSLAGQTCAAEIGAAGTTALDVLAKIPSVLQKNSTILARHQFVKHNTQD